MGFTYAARPIHKLANRPGPVSIPASPSSSGPAPPKAKPPLVACGWAQRYPGLRCSRRDAPGVATLARATNCGSGPCPRMTCAPIIHWRVAPTWPAPSYVLPSTS